MEGAAELAGARAAASMPLRLLCYLSLKRLAQVAKNLCALLPAAYASKPRLLRHVPVPARYHFLTPVRRCCQAFSSHLENRDAEAMFDTLKQLMSIPRACLVRPRAGDRGDHFSALKRQIARGAKTVFPPGSAPASVRSARFPSSPSSPS